MLYFLFGWIGSCVGSREKAAFFSLYDFVKECAAALVVREHQDFNPHLNHG